MLIFVSEKNRPLLLAKGVVTVNRKQHGCILNVMVQIKMNEFLMISNSR